MTYYVFCFASEVFSNYGYNIGASALRLIQYIESFNEMRSHGDRLSLYFDTALSKQIVAPDK